MKERVIAIVILVIILAGAGLGGYYIHSAVNKNKNNTQTAELEKSKADLQKQIDELKKQPGATITANAVIAPLFSKPGYSRYLSNSGLTFIFKTKVNYQGEERELAVKDEVSYRGLEIYLYFKDFASVSQTDMPDPSFSFTIIDRDASKTVQQTVDDFWKKVAEKVGESKVDKAPLVLVSADKALAVKRYQPGNGKNPVNSYAVDKSADVWVEFTDNQNLMAHAYYYSYFEEFRGMESEIIDSISMVK